MAKTTGTSPTKVCGGVALVPAGNISGGLAIQASVSYSSLHSLLSKASHRTDTMASSISSRPAFAGAAGRTAARPQVQRARIQICAAFKNKENIDLSKVVNYAHHANDCGSTEVQIARLTARVQQMSAHLKQNRKDYSSRRGLEAVLSQRKSLMQYLYKHNRAAYDRLVVELGIRSVVAGDSHKAAQRAAAAAEAQ